MFFSWNFSMLLCVSSENHWKLLGRFLEVLEVMLFCVLSYWTKIHIYWEKRDNLFTKKKVRHYNKATSDKSYIIKQSSRNFCQTKSRHRYYDILYFKMWENKYKAKFKKYSVKLYQDMDIVFLQMWENGAPISSLSLQFRVSFRVPIPGVI